MTSCWNELQNVGWRYFILINIVLCTASDSILLHSWRSMGSTHACMHSAQLPAENSIWDVQPIIYNRNGQEQSGICWQASEVYQCRCSVQYCLDSCCNLATVRCWNMRNNAVELLAWCCFFYCWSKWRRCFRFELRSVSGTSTSSRDTLYYVCNFAGVEQLNF